MNTCHMKRILLTLVLALAGLACCRAQDVMLWSDGPVNWAGYRIASPRDTADYFIDFTLYKDKKTLRTPGVTYHYLDFTAAIITYRSWIKKEAMNEEVRSAIQKDLDILEYFARAYRDDLLFATNRDSVKEDRYILGFRIAQKEALLTGDYGKYALSSTPLDVSAIAYETDPKHTGISVGLFTDLPLGDQGRLLYPTAGISLLLERGRRDESGLGVQAQFGYAPFRREYMDVRQTAAPYASALVQYRKEISTRGRWHFSLQGGAGFAGRIFENAGQRVLVGGPALSEGISADFYAGRIVALSYGHPEQSDRFVQVKLSCNQLYNVRRKTVFPAINLSVGYGFQTHSIRRR